MTPMPDLLTSIITSLRAEPGTNLVKRRVDPSSPVAVYVSLAEDRTQLGVLLTVQHRLVPAKSDLPSGAGFEARTQTFPDDAKGIVNLGVFCTEQACEDIFLHFMNDLISHVILETKPEAAVRTFLTRLALWQRFFVSAGSAFLTEEAQCGLFAELLILRDLLIPALSPSAAVAAWKGPDAGPQDFQTQTCAIEVKCTRAKAGGKIPISNEQQLDERPFPHLVLAHIAVAAAGGNNNQSLVDLVATIQQHLAGSGNLLGVFNDRLITAGWIDAHATHYSENRFFVRSTHYYEVKDAFPRIRVGEHLSGVTDVTYKIDPAMLTQFEVQKSEVEAWLKS